MNKKIGISFIMCATVFFLVAFYAGQKGYAMEIWLMLSILCAIIGLVGLLCKKNFLLKSFAGVMFYFAILSYLIFGILPVSLSFLLMFIVLLCVTVRKNKQNSN